MVSRILEPCTLGSAISLRDKVQRYKAPPSGDGVKAKGFIHAVYVQQWQHPPQGKDIAYSVSIQKLLHNSPLFLVSKLLSVLDDES